jgi:hypothetical protein
VSTHYALEQFSVNPTATLEPTLVLRAFLVVVSGLKAWKILRGEQEIESPSKVLDRLISMLDNPHNYPILVFKMS